MLIITPDKFVFSRNRERTASLEVILSLLEEGGKATTTDKPSFSVYLKKKAKNGEH